MRSPTIALIWEQWRQVRWVALGGLLIAALMSVSLWYSPIAPSQWIELNTTISGCVLTFVGVSMWFAHSSAKDLRMGLPARMLTLPVSGFRLAVAQVGFRFAIVFLMATALWAISTMVDARFAALWVPMAGISLLLYAYASVIGYTIGKNSPAAAVVVTLVTLPPVMWTIGSLNESLPTSWRNGYAGFIIFGAIWVAVSVVAIMLARRPFRGFPIALQGYAFLKPALSGNPCCWIEMRRSGAMFPTAALAQTLIIFCFYFFIAVGAASDHPYQRHLFSFSIALYLTAVIGPAIWAMAFGLLLYAREQRDAASGLALFAWTRPQTIEQIVLGRMAATAKSFLMTYVPIGLLVLLISVFSNQLAMAQSINIAQIFGYAALICGAWMLIWVPYLAIAYWLVALPYIVLEANDVHLASQGDAIFLQIVPSLVFLVLFVAASKAITSRKLFSKSTIVGFAAAGAPVLAGGVFIVITELSAIASGSAYVWRVTLIAGVVSVAAASLIPMFALFSYGLFLDRVRHGAFLKNLPPRSA